MVKSYVVMSSVISLSVTRRAASLYSGVDERLGIDPAVEFGRVAAPFHQSLRSSAYLTVLQYRHLLQLQFVEGAVQHFTEIVDQSVHGWIGGMNSYHVAFFELTLVLMDAHAI